MQSNCGVLLCYLSCHVPAESHFTILAGTIKLTMPLAFSTAMLAWGLLEFPSVSTFHHAF